MKQILPKITEQYINAIQEYLVTPGKLWPASTEMGHRLLALGLGAADVAAIHQQALEVVLENCSSSKACIQIVRLGSQFLTKVLLPFEQQEGEEEKQQSSTSLEGALLKQAEVALKEAYQRLTYHVENSPLAMVEWNLTSGVLRWSSQAEKIFGWKAQEVIGKQFSDWRFIHEEELAGVNEVIAGLIDGSIQRNVYQNRNYRKDGTVLEVEWYNSALVDDRGNVVSILSLAQDITAQKKAERQRDALVRQLEKQVKARTKRLAAELARREETEAILKNLVESTAAFTGDDFFPVLVEHLASALGVDTAIVSELHGESLHTLACWSNGQLQPNMVYKLAGTPCEITIAKGEYYCEKEVQSTFPEVPELANLDAESYLGVGLLDRTGKPIGNLCIIDDRCLLKRDLFSDILKIFGARAAAELERQKTTEALRLIQFSLNRVKDAVFLSARDGKFLYVNDAACSNLGYTQEELLAMKVYDLNSQDSKTKWFDFWDKLKDRGTITIKSFHISKDGREFPVEISSNYLLFDDKEYHCAIARDLSDRQLTEAALRQTQALFQNMAANVPGMLYQYLKNPDGGDAFIYVSSSSGEILELEPEKLLENSQVLWEIIHPNDRSSLEESIDISAHTLQQWRWEGRIITPSGNLKWIQGISRPKQEPNGEIIWDGIVVDISDRKEAEAQLYESQQLLKLVMDNIPQAIFWKDRSSVYLGCNYKFAMVAGVREPSNIVGKTDYDLPWERAEADFYREYDARVMNNNIPEEGIIEPQHRADGQIRWLETSKIPLHDTKGNVVGILGTFEDITERLQAEDALRKSEEKFRHLVETINDWVWEVDANFVFTYSSPKVFDLLGYQPEELLGKTPFALMPTKESRRIANAYKELAIAGGAFNRLENIYQRINTQIVILETSGVPIFDGEGNFRGYRGVARDITASKQAREALRESEEKFRQLAENIDSVFWMTNLDGSQFIYVSPAYEKIWGRSLASVYASPQSWIDAIHPEDRDRVIATGSQELPRGCEGEYRIIRATSQKNTSGEIRWICDRAFPIKNELGEIYRFGGIAEDITKRKLAEEALKSSQHFIQRIADASPNILYIYDLIEQRNFYVNRQIATILGYTSLEVQELRSTFLQTLVHPSDYPLLEAHLAQFNTANDGEILTMEYRIKHRNDEWRWIFSRDTVFSRTSDGKVQQILGTATDITERKEAEAKIKASLKQKELLLKEIHHRVKNNLQIVSSLLWLQANTIEDPAVVRLFEDSQNRINSMALVHQKLYGSDDLSRINLGEYLEDLVYYLCESYNINLADIELQINVEPISLNIETVTPCGTIVTELVSNIFKYAFPDLIGDRGQEGKISSNKTNAVAVIQCYQRPEDRKIILIVGDNGVGLPESIDFPKTKSLGLQLVWDLTKQLKATLQLDKSNGTKYQLTFTELYYPDRF